MTWCFTHHAGKGEWRLLRKPSAVLWAVMYTLEQDGRWLTSSSGLWQVFYFFLLGVWLRFSLDSPEGEPADKLRSVTVQHGRGDGWMVNVRTLRSSHRGQCDFESAATTKGFQSCPRDYPHAFLSTRILSESRMSSGSAWKIKCGATTSNYLWHDGLGLSIRPPRKAYRR